MLINLTYYNICLAEVILNIYEFVENILNECSKEYGTDLPKEEIPWKTGNLS